MELSAVIPMLEEEMRGIEGKWLKFKMEGEIFSISEVGWEQQGQKKPQTNRKPKQLERVLGTGKMSAFLC